MTDCVEVRSLVDKLADFEATASEKLAAEAHLARCPSCRGHIEFLASLNAESRALSFPEPPESYWEHLPRKVLARIDSEDGRRGISRIPFAPPILRWGALGATLVLVTALGVTLLREEGPKAPAPAAPTPAPATQALESEAPPPVAPIESPPMARDEAAPETARAEALAGARKSEPASEDSRETPAAPEEATVSMESNEVEVSSFRTAAPEPRENAPVLESADRARSAEVPATPGSAFEDCDALRRTLAALGSEEAFDARYRLALCSFERLEREATKELRTLAIEDAEAFLAGESDGPRAEEIREKIRGVR